MTEVSLRYLNHPEVNTYVVPQTASPGTRTGDPCPSFVAARLYRKTDLGGKHGRGMIRLAGISETDTTGNAPSAGLVTALEALAVSLEAALTGGGLGSLIAFPALVEIQKMPEAPLEYVVRSGIVTNWVSGAFLGHQLTRARRATV
jgi:hypothetical protein